MVLALALHEVLGGVDEEHVVGLLALLEHEDADGDVGGVEEVRGQADHGVDVAVLEQFGSDAFLRSASEEDSMRQDDGHHAFRFQIVEAVEQEGEVGCGLGGEAVALETHIFAHRVSGFPTKAEGRIGGDGVEARLLGRVLLPHHVPFVEQGVAVKDFELRVLHPVQQHVHAGEVVGGDILLLAEDLADGAARLVHLLAHAEDQRAGATGHVHHAFQPHFRASLRFLAVQRDDGGEDVGHRLRGVELARLLAGPGGKLANQVFIGIAQRVNVCRETCQSFGDFLDDPAKHEVPVLILFPQLGRAKVDRGEQALEGALEGFRLDVFEARLQRVQQLRILGAGQVGDAVPEVPRLDDVMHLAPHLFLELRDIVHVVRIPQCQRHLAGVAFDIWVIPSQFLPPAVS